MAAPQNRARPAGSSEVTIPSFPGFVAKVTLPIPVKEVQQVDDLVWSERIGPYAVNVALRPDAARPANVAIDTESGDSLSIILDPVARADQARAAGVTEVWIDPGIGFGKTLEHNLDLLANLDLLVATGYPVLVGTSRKTTLGRLAARADGTDTVPPPGDRLAGSVATAAWAFLQGAAMVRAHEVTATVRAAEAAASVREDREEQSWHR